MSRNFFHISICVCLSRYFYISVATVIATNFLSFLVGFRWIATMKHARANLTHFHCTYFHIFFFFPLIALFPSSLSFYFPLFLSSVSLRYNSLSFASHFPLHHFSRYSSFHSFSFSIFIRAYPIPTTPLRVPLFLSLDFLSLTCTIHSMCLAHSQTMQFSRLRAIFAE